MNDDQLIKQLNQGSEKAMEYIFRTNYADLCTIAHCQLNVSSLAPDIVQELMLDIWKRRTKIVLVSASIKTYLIRALQYKISHANRQHKKYENISDESVISDVEDGDKIESLKNQVKAALQCLSERQRECFTLSRDQGLTHKEIATYLNISAKTVDHHITKALAILREELKNSISWVYPLGLLYFFF